ncbi:MAG: DEAD/DEAH box helicase [Candidatus Marinimicrobia bacterium]|nr:DEAD/DEAH box helicase [Candidatus Neomarinimicrobiota bacterium]
MQLRPYQIQAVDNIRNFFAKGGLHAVLQAATGSGKTVIFTHLAKLVSDKTKKILILTDRAELLFQAAGSLKKIGLNAMYIQAGCKIINNQFNCYIAMSQTLRRRIVLDYWVEFLQNIDLLIIDECHKQEFNYIFESQIFDKKHVIGFTATPRRTGKQRQLAIDYEIIIETISVRELINHGYLVNDDYYGFGAPDLSDVEFDYKKGDYKESSLFKKFNNPKTYSGAIKAYQKHVPDTKTICFCINIEHCIRTAIEFNKNGISAKFIVSNLAQPKVPEGNNPGKLAQYEERKKVYDLLQENKHLTGPRKEIFTDFKNDKFKILINAGIATTGYDEPSLVTVIVLRATLSTTLWLQMLGRGSRPFNLKTHFNIFDFGGNADRLGHYTEDRLWGLWHETFEGEGLPPIKECGFDSSGKPITDKPGCKRPILAAYKICPFCGFKYPDKEHKEVDIDLIIFDQQMKRAIKTKRLKDMTFKELHNYRKMKGHKQAWLWRQLWYRGGENCIKEFGSEFNWSSATVDRAVGFMR